MPTVLRHRPACQASKVFDGTPSESDLGGAKQQVACKACHSLLTHLLYLSSSRCCTACAAAHDPGVTKCCDHWQRG